MGVGHYDTEHVPIGSDLRPVSSVEYFSDIHPRPAWKYIRGEGEGGGLEYDADKEEKKRYSRVPAIIH